MGLELDDLGADGEVGEPLVAPEAGERGVVRHAAVQRELGRGDEEDEALALVRAAAVRARFGAIAERGKVITRERGCPARTESRK